MKYQKEKKIKEYLDLIHQFTKKADIGKIVQIFEDSIRYLVMKHG
jgi:hypothetical protein